MMLHWQDGSNLLDLQMLVVDKVCLVGRELPIRTYFIVFSPNSHLSICLSMSLYVSFVCVCVCVCVCVGGGMFSVTVNMLSFSIVSQGRDPITYDISNVAQRQALEASPAQASSCLRYFVDCI